MKAPIIYSAKTNIFPPDAVFQSTKSSTSFNVQSKVIIEFRTDGYIYISSTTGDLYSDPVMGAAGTLVASMNSNYTTPWYTGTPAAGSWKITIKATSSLHYNNVTSFVNVDIYDGYLDATSTGVNVLNTSIISGSGTASITATDLNTFLSVGSAEKIRIELLCEQQDAGTSYGHLELYVTISDPSPTTSTTVARRLQIGAISQSSYSGGGGGGECFLAGTPILMSNGLYKNIENILIGDVLASEMITSIVDESDPNWFAWSTNDATFKTSYLSSANVAGIQTFAVGEYYRINGTICATGGHVMFVKRNDTWLYSRVSDLVIGDIFFTSGQTELTLSSLELFTANVDVYLLDVESNDCYFVGNENILVHNAKPIP